MVSREGRWIGSADSERSRDPRHDQERWVRRSALDAADVVLVDVREFGELLLGVAALVA
jgi:hypothetical protein